MPILGYDVIDKKLVPNEIEAKTIHHIFENYLSCGSLNQLTHYLNENDVYNKKWTTIAGELKGGKKLISATVHRILRDKVYIGKIEHKAIKQTFDGQHQAIIPLDLFNQVQEKLSSQNNCKSRKGSISPNLLSGKLFSSDARIYKNQTTIKSPNNIKRYYAIKGNYLPAPQIDDVAREVVKDVLNVSCGQLNKNLSLKQICLDDFDYFQKTEFIKKAIKKIIYNQDKFTFFISTNIDDLRGFISEHYINPNNQIIIEKQLFIQKGIARNVYNAGKNGVVNIQDNNHLTTRAFVYAYKHKNMYGGGLGIDDIVAAYKYLNLAYLSPNIVNDLMSGKKQISIQILFQVSSKYQTFIEQEKVFYI